MLQSCALYISHEAVSHVTWWCAKSFVLFLHWEGKKPFMTSPAWDMPFLFPSLGVYCGPGGDSCPLLYNLSLYLTFLPFFMAQHLTLLICEEMQNFASCISRKFVTAEVESLVFYLNTFLSKGRISVHDPNPSKPICPVLQGSFISS